jgi:gamma-glutamylcyclotransferase (GGCT)/AIG2-like uncharacterized protein YtfP
MPEPTSTTPASSPLIAPLTGGERYFFVYGTLRQGDDNDITRLQPAPRFIGPARIKGLMAHLGGYPGVTLGGDKDIIGEVYAVSQQLEQRLDAIESEYPAQPDEYAKRSISVTVHGQDLPCFVYEINPAYTVGKPSIASGDWVKDR